MKERVCSKCGASKPLDQEHFYADTRYAEGFHRQCRTCREAYNTSYQTQDRKDRPEFYRDREFRREMKAYGTTVGWYRGKLIAQRGLCALCNHLSHLGDTIQRLQIDHDHVCCDTKTKSCGRCLRGLLCGPCNLRLSYLEATFFDCSEMSPNEGSWTEWALKYLQHYKYQWYPVADSTQETPA